MFDKEQCLEDTPFFFQQLKRDPQYSYIRALEDCYGADQLAQISQYDHMELKNTLGWDAWTQKIVLRFLGVPVGDYLNIVTPKPHEKKALMETISPGLIMLLAFIGCRLEDLWSVSINGYGVRVELRLHSLEHHLVHLPRRDFNSIKRWVEVESRSMTIQDVRNQWWQAEKSSLITVLCTPEQFRLQKRLMDEYYYNYLIEGDVGRLGQ